MSDFHNENNTCFFKDRIEDPIIPLTNAIDPVFSFQFFMPRRKRIFSELFYFFRNLSEIYFRYFL